MIITIDGPAASGKSTVAKLLAKKLGFYYLYTGLLYRAIGYILNQKLNVNVGKFPSLSFEDFNFVEDIEYIYENGQPNILYKGENITDKLSNSLVDDLSSKIGVNKYAREALLEKQRDVGEKYNIIVDGRDTGSVVFPSADYKFFLTASLDVRAKRRCKDLNVKFEDAKAWLAERDQRDMKRAVAPLIVPKGGIVIDNSDLNMEETINKFLEQIDIN